MATALLQIQEPFPNGQARTAEVPEAAKQHIVKTYGKLPLRFEANQGQTDSQVKFLSRGNGYTLFLNSTEAVLRIQSRPRQANPSRDREGAVNKPEERQPDPMLRMQLVGANPHPEASGLEELPGHSNYFIGSDPEKWRTNVPNYAKVEYRDIYPGVDLIYYGNQRQLEYDFVVAPGVDYKSIALHFAGADEVEVDAQGDLVLHTAGEQIRLRKPLIYQETDGVRQEVDGGYVLQGEQKVGFQVAAYDLSKPLVIDPVLVYSTYLGGSAFDQGVSIAVDSAGNAYVTGFTESFDFPTAGSLQANCGGGFGGRRDVFVTKLNASGSALEYSTYLGGSGDDGGISISLDSSGNAYLMGTTDSPDFPTTSPFQPTFGGGSNDLFVTKLNSAGSALVYSTYLGGNGGDLGSSIAVDAADNAYVTGFTRSTDFPTVSPLQAVKGVDADAFVTKINASGSALVYSTYLGGSGSEFGSGIAVDAAGNAYVTGNTFSSDFPTASPFQANCPGGSFTACFDAFATKLNAQGSALVYSTYLGGSGDDLGSSIAVDAVGNAYVTGETRSTDFPTATPFQAANGGLNDVFVAKLNASGSALVYSTYLGGSSSDRGIGIAVDAAGNAYVTGNTMSTDFPTASPFQATIGGFRDDAFVAKLNASGSALVYSTYLGGSEIDQVVGIAVDAVGNAYVTGNTQSTNFPTVSPFQATSGGGFEDAFVAKIAELPQGAPILLPNSVVNSASFRAATDPNGAIAPGTIVSIFGTDLAGTTETALTVPFPTTLGETSVTFNDIPVPLFFVSPTQINAQVPFDVLPGEVSVQVQRGSETSAVQTVTVAAVSPGIFTLNAQGSGAGAILHEETFQLVSENNPASPGESLSIFCAGLGPLQESVPPGDIPPTPPPQTTSQPQVNIADIPGEVTYSGLASGFVGLYRVNVQVPASVPSGTQNLEIIINGVPSNTVTIAVE